MSLIKSNAKKARLTPETSETPAGIYVHIPFCQTKCPYCSFVSYPGIDSKVKIQYIQALNSQAQQMSTHAWSSSRKFHSLFVGGGNPPCLDTEQMATFIASCLEAFNFKAILDKVPEVTLEANPNSINLEKLKQYGEAGVNRVSIGIQAFSDTMLANIGRKHTAKEGIKAFEAARAAGFSNINLDLMYGLPGQDVDNWEDTLQQALALSPEHLSVYELTIEQGTPFEELARQERLDLPPEEVTLSMFEHAQEVLSANGYRQYEISNYAREGFECINNINYWENGSYIGLGGGAVSCFSGVRIKSEENPVKFIQMVDAGRMPFKEAEFLSLYARFRETVIMGLRMKAGISIPRLEKQFGLTPQQYYGDTINELMNQELLEEVNEKLRLTQKGLLLANRVMEQLV